MPALRLWLDGSNVDRNTHGANTTDSIIGYSNIKYQVLGQGVGVHVETLLTRSHPFILLLVILRQGMGTPAVSSNFLEIVNDTRILLVDCETN